MRTEGFCSAPLYSCDIRDKVRNGILALFRDQLYFSATKQRRTKSFGTHVHNTSNNTSTKLQLQRIKLHIEIVNLKPVTPTRILLPKVAVGGEEVEPFINERAKRVRVIRTIIVFITGFCYFDKKQPALIVIILNDNKTAKMAFYNRQKVMIRMFVSH